MHLSVCLRAARGRVGLDGAAWMQARGAAGASQEGAGPELAQPALACRHQQVCAPSALLPTSRQGSQLLAAA